MTRQRWRWISAAALCCLLGAPVMAQSSDDSTTSVPFAVKSGAVYATSNVEDGGRLRVRFLGEGEADVSRTAVSLSLEELTQVNGDRTLSVTPDGDLERVGRARLFAGTGTATVTDANGDVTFEKVGIVVSLRGYGNRLKMIGKFRAKEVDSSGALPPDILRGVVRGRPVPVDTATE